MRYFKHLCSMLDDPRIQALHKKLGLEAYAIWLAVLERIGSHGDQFSLDTRSPIHSLRTIAERLGVKPDVVRSTLDEASRLGLSDRTAWSRHKIVYVPKMVEYVDEWTQRLISDGKFPNKPKCIIDLELKSNSNGNSEHSGGTRDCTTETLREPPPLRSTTTATATKEGGVGEGNRDIHPEMDILPWMEKVCREKGVRWPKIKYPDQFVNQEREFGTEEYRAMFVDHLTTPGDQSPIAFARKFSAGFKAKKVRTPAEIEAEDIAALGD